MRTRSILLLTTVLCGSAWGQTYTISTIAGGGLPVNVPGKSASLSGPVGIAADRAGNLFFVDLHTVLRWDAATGILSLVAGNGTPGFSGDNGPAASAQLRGPSGVAVDSSGNLYNGNAAPMIYASSTQVSAVVPYEMAPVASPSVWIKYGGQTSNGYQVTTTPTAPGLFTQNASGSGAGAILNQDNSVNGPGNPAAKGSIAQVYLTGEGQTSPPSVTGEITTATLPPPQVTPAPLLSVGVLINGQPATWTYAGEAPGMVAGVMQLNVQIPAYAPSGPLSIQVSIGGTMSQSGITVSVQ